MEQNYIKIYQQWKKLPFQPLYLKKLLKICYKPDYHIIIILLDISRTTLIN